MRKRQDADTTREETGLRNGFIGNLYDPRVVRQAMFGEDTAREMSKDNSDNASEWVSEFRKPTCAGFDTVAQRKNFAKNRRLSPATNYLMRAKRIVFGLYNKIVLLEQRVSEEIVFHMAKTLLRAKILNIHDDTDHRIQDRFIRLSKRYISNLASLAFYTDDDCGSTRSREFDKTLDDAEIGYYSSSSLAVRSGDNVDASWDDVSLGDNVEASWDQKSDICCISDHDWANFHADQSTGLQHLSTNLLNIVRSEKLALAAREDAFRRLYSKLFSVADADNTGLPSNALIEQIKLIPNMPDELMNDYDVRMRVGFASDTGLPDSALSTANNYRFNLSLAKFFLAVRGIEGVQVATGNWFQNALSSSLLRGNLGRQYTHARKRRAEDLVRTKRSILGQFFASKEFTMHDEEPGDNLKKEEINAGKIISAVIFEPFLRAPITKIKSAWEDVKEFFTGANMEKDKTERDARDTDEKEAYRSLDKAQSWVAPRVKVAMRVFDILSAASSEVESAFQTGEENPQLVRLPYTFERRMPDGSVVPSMADEKFYSLDVNGAQGSFYGLGLGGMSRKTRFPQTARKLKSEDQSLSEKHALMQKYLEYNKVPQLDTFYVTANQCYNESTKSIFGIDLTGLSDTSRGAMAQYEAWLTELRDWNAKLGPSFQGEKRSEETFEETIVRRNESLLFEGAKPLWKHFLLKNLVENASTALQQSYSEHLREEFAKGSGSELITQAEFQQYSTDADTDLGLADTASRKIPLSETNLSFFGVDRESDPESDFSIIGECLHNPKMCSSPDGKVLLRRMVKDSQNEGHKLIVKENNSLRKLVHLKSGGGEKKKNCNTAIEVADEKKDCNTAIEVPKIKILVLDMHPNCLLQKAVTVELITNAQLEQTSRNTIKRSEYKVLNAAGNSTKWKKRFFEKQKNHYLSKNKSTVVIQDQDAVLLIDLAADSTTSLTKRYAEAKSKIEEDYLGKSTGMLQPTIKRVLNVDQPVKATSRVLNRRRAEANTSDSIKEQTPGPSAAARKDSEKMESEQIHDISYALSNSQAKNNSLSQGQHTIAARAAAIFSLFEWDQYTGVITASQPDIMRDLFYNKSTHEPTWQRQAQSLRPHFAHERSSLQSEPVKPHSNRSTTLDRHEDRVRRKGITVVRLVRWGSIPMPDCQWDSDAITRVDYYQGADKNEAWGFYERLYHRLKKEFTFQQDGKIKVLNNFPLQHTDGRTMTNSLNLPYGVDPSEFFGKDLSDKVRTDTQREVFLKTLMLGFLRTSTGAGNVMKRDAQDLDWRKVESKTSSENKIPVYSVCVKGGWQELLKKLFWHAPSRTLYLKEKVELENPYNEIITDNSDALADSVPLEVPNGCLWLAHPALVSEIDTAWSRTRSVARGGANVHELIRQKPGRDWNVVDDRKRDSLKNWNGEVPVGTTITYRELERLLIIQFPQIPLNGSENSWAPSIPNFSNAAGPPALATLGRFLLSDWVKLLNSLEKPVRIDSNGKPYPSFVSSLGTEGPLSTLGLDRLKNDCPMFHPLLPDLGMDCLTKPKSLNNFLKD